MSETREQAARRRGEADAYEITIMMLEDLLVQTGEIIDLDDHALEIRKTASAIVYKVNARMEKAQHDQTD